MRWTSFPNSVERIKGGIGGRKVWKPSTNWHCCEHWWFYHSALAVADEGDGKIGKIGKPLLLSGSFSIWLVCHTKNYCRCSTSSRDLAPSSSEYSCLLFHVRRAAARDKASCSAISREELENKTLLHSVGIKSIADNAIGIEWQYFCFKAAVAEMRWLGSRTIRHFKRAIKSGHSSARGNIFSKGWGS